MRQRWLESMRRWAADHWPRALALGLIACGLLPLFGRAGNVEAGASDRASHSAAHEWPIEWDGAPLRPLALTAVEQRFAEQFPGRIGRFQSAEAVWVLRDVQRPTRALHPATDCFRALGYRIESARLETDGGQRLWRCFIAVHQGQRVRVCERIVDAQGEAFTDASSWFWAAAMGRSSGPWRAVTRVESL